MSDHSSGDNNLVWFEDRRHSDIDAGSFELIINSSLIRFRSGPSGISEILFFEEESVRKIYEQLGRMLENEEEDFE